MDLRVAGVVPAETSARMRAISPTLYNPEDEIAIITASMLLTMQLRRAFTIGERNIFLSIDEAQAWLLSERPAA